VGWNDYIGTSAADDAEVVPDRPSLYTLARIDRERWTILAIDLKVTEGDPTVTVYAIDRSAHGITGVADLDDLGQRLGELPVTAFPLPEQHVDDFINDAFRSLSVRLVSKEVRDQILVAGHAVEG
jgi:hypothetical protein